MKILRIYKQQIKRHFWLKPHRGHNLSIVSNRVIPRFQYVWGVVHCGMPDVAWKQRSLDLCKNRDYRIRYHPNTDFVAPDLCVASFWKFHKNVNRGLKFGKNLIDTLWFDLELSWRISNTYALIKFVNWSSYSKFIHAKFLTHSSGF